MSDFAAGSTEGIDVEYVAALARLKLSDDECKLFKSQLADIVGYVEKIRELDLVAVEPMAHGVAVQNVFRSDEPADSQPVDQAMSNAPASRDDQFLVPKIVE